MPARTESGWKRHAFCSPLILETAACTSSTLRLIPALPLILNSRNEGNLERLTVVSNWQAALRK
jgi:hypothetical protein